MLELKNIIKEYSAGDSTVTALKGVSLSFRDNEFVSILGPSGCGKTTLLNIIGGLDRYTSGDLTINGRSTKEFADKDWDAYRNHSIGFVFQSYNLIPHQSVLSNVELALTLSGVPKEERRRRAVEALEKVGLADQLKKRPNQLSGGQMQRVAIARALVNDPDILLADEPTGALDSDTSVQIMNLLAEIAHDKLIIMVTHNAELAEQYSSRIVRLLDGNIVGDTDPFDSGSSAPVFREKKDKTKRTSMSFFTALSLSFNNLLTKKGRTFMTAFAGSIGIIGIALILAMSTGVQRYINDVQEETLSSYPIVLEAEQNDLGTMLSAFSEISREERHHDLDAVYSNSKMYSMFNAVFTTEPTVNNLSGFKTYLDSSLASESDEGIGNRISDVHYGYNVTLNTYVTGTDGKYHSCELDMFSNMNESSGMSFIPGSSSSYEQWQELMPGRNGEPVSEIISSQYELIYGRWPSELSDIVLIVDANNEITDLTYYALGLIPEENITRIFAAAMNGEEIASESPVVSYDDICSISFKLLINSDLYADRSGNGVWEYIGDDDAMLDLAIKKGLDLHIVGIIRPTEDANSVTLNASFGYTSALTAYIINSTNSSAPVIAQTDPANSNMDVLTGLPFTITEETDPSDSYKADTIRDYYASLDDAGKAAMLVSIYAIPDESQLTAAVDSYMSQFKTRADLVSLAASTYGMDETSAEAYLASYSDDELTGIVRDAVQDFIVGEYERSAEERVDEIKNSPSEEELAEIIAGITARIPDTATKCAYVAAKWTSATSMPPQTVMSYLAGLSSEELDAAVADAAAEDAAIMYASVATPGGDAGNAKAAAVFDSLIVSCDTDTLAEYYDRFMPSLVSDSTYRDNLDKLGVLDLSAPSSISIYCDTFENKDSISDYIAQYNDAVENEDDRISYTDYVALLMSGITTIIDAISYGLIIFVSVSLVVSSIMIGIITYVSVLERTKEIGILRAVGASKRDISRVFNAETLLIGFSSGLIGIILSLLLCIPINLIVHALAGIDDINAFLPGEACVILVLISMALTLIAGLIPAGVAARKDPVEALRTE